MLQVNQLNFDYPDKPLLQNIQFTVNSGTLLHIRGCNGSGKTTLLKLLAGLLSPMTGRIDWNDVPISNDMAAYQQNLCYVGHKTGVSQLLTVEENCHFELSRQQTSKSDREIIQALGLESVKELPCGLLSVGQRRRVSLLRLFMSRAPLWLLDEPFVALDQQTLSTIMDLFDLHLKQKGIIVLTSHQNIPSTNISPKEYFL